MVSQQAGRFFIRDVPGQDEEASEDEEVKQDDEEGDQRRGRAGAERASGTAIAI